MSKLKKRKELPMAGILTGGGSKNNKTGSWKDLEPVWDKDKCIHCMKCVNNCPENCIILKKLKDGTLERGKTNLDYCKGCGICAQICPVKAIQMKKSKKD